MDIMEGMSVDDKLGVLARNNARLRFQLFELGKRLDNLSHILQEFEVRISLLEDK